MVSRILLLFCLSFAGSASAQTTLKTEADSSSTQLSAEEVLKRIQLEAASLYEEMEKQESTYPLEISDVQEGLVAGGRTLIRLQGLFERKENPKGRVSFASPWPKSFERRATQLVELWAQGSDLETLQDATHALYVTYKKAIVAAYTYLEFAKRRHILSPPPSVPAGPDADTVSAALEKIHVISQRSLRWFHTFRHDNRFKGLTKERLFPLDAWEERFGERFFYRGALGSDSFPWKKRVDLGKFLDTVEPLVLPVADSK